MPGNNGGPPTGNNGQHDRGGDLQGQADILHKVNILLNIPISNILHKANILYSHLHFHTSPTCRVFDVASQDLYTMGIMVVSYTIKDVSDEVKTKF